jgi:hypothetical protein
VPGQPRRTPGPRPSFPPGTDNRPVCRPVRRRPRPSPRPLRHNESGPDAPPLAWPADRSALRLYLHNQALWGMNAPR